MGGGLSLNSKGKIYIYLHTSIDKYAYLFLQTQELAKDTVTQDE